MLDLSEVLRVVVVGECSCGAGGCLFEVFIFTLFSGVIQAT